MGSDPQSLPKIWSLLEEKALVSVRINMDKAFSSGIKDHRNMWGKVRSELNNLDISATQTQIINKWNQLKKRYKEVKDHNRQTGNDRKKFKFIEEFDDLYGEKASTEPMFNIDSMTGESRKSNKKTDSGDKTKSQKPPQKRTSERQLEIMESMLINANSLAEEAKKFSESKLARMDRFLDIFEKSAKRNDNTEE